MFREDELQQCVDNLCRVQLFCSLSPEQLLKIAALCELTEYAAGDQLTVESAAAQDIFLLLSGEVSVSKQLRLPQLSAAEGLDRILTKLSGDSYPILGETALLGQATRRASVRCLTACSLYKIHAGQLTALAEHDSAIGYAVFRQLSAMLFERLESANNDVLKLSAALIFALEE